MAGRGRGIAAFTFNIEALGLSRGCMPETRMGPNPVFPITEFKPVALKAGEDEDYMLALKQEMREVMKRLPHNIKPLSGKPEVERYKQRYLKQDQGAEDEWTPDWNLFPEELKPRKKKPCAKQGTKKKSIMVSSAEKEAVLSKLNELEKKGDDNEEKSDEEKEKEKKKEGDEDEEIEEECEDEELEEENDYIDNYFDNGEDFAAGGSDDNMDAEATY